MKRLKTITILAATAALLATALPTHAQNDAVATALTAPLAGAALLSDSTDAPDGRLLPADDSIAPSSDSIAQADDKDIAAGDSIARHHKRDWNTWRPTPKRALWLALVLPGGGQIYNRKYWKLPIIYGGFVGCAYAMRWNNMMYRDYSQAYLDIMDDDPTTESYNQFLHLGSQITDANKSRWQEIFRKRKDRYRRWRDMSFFVMVGVYALSVIDAYVDASLSEFDISPDLSLHVAPAVLNASPRLGDFSQAAIGLQCCLNF